jgi:hypothetical protein
MNKSSTSSYDKFVETLIESFRKIPNFDLMMTEPEGKRVFNLLIFRLSDIASYRDLVIKSFIPATNKAIVESKSMVAKSKYKNFVSIAGIDYVETLHDVIRLAYVGMFHKFESFINDLQLVPQIIFGEILDSEQSVVEWAKTKFDFQLKDWLRFDIIHKINWVCNCVKHFDGYPDKTPIPLTVFIADRSKRIELTTEDFKEDSKRLIDMYSVYLQILLGIGAHKLAYEEMLKADEPFLSQLMEQLIKMELGLNTLVSKDYKLLLSK